MCGIFVVIGTLYIIMFYMCVGYIRCYSCIVYYHVPYVCGVYSSLLIHFILLCSLCVWGTFVVIDTLYIIMFHMCVGYIRCYSYIVYYNVLYMCVVYSLLLIHCILLCSICVWGTFVVIDT